jgi:HPt (histidine-containing phosphotransfer) domain-containing protein
VNEFIETCREKVATMHALLQEQDFDQLARAAHWLKGSGGSAGFEPLMPAAAELEDSAKQQAANACTASLQKIDELVARLQRAEPPAFQPG